MVELLNLVSTGPLMSTRRQPICGETGGGFKSFPDGSEGRFLRLYPYGLVTIRDILVLSY